MLDKGSPDKSVPREHDERIALRLNRLTHLEKRILWLCWTLATVLGATAGGVAMRVLGRQNVFLLTGAIAAFGFVTGLSQALVLWPILWPSSKSGRPALQWMFASFLGWAGGSLAGTIVMFGVGLVLLVLFGVDAGYVPVLTLPVLWPAIVLLGAGAVSNRQQRIVRTAGIPDARWFTPSILGWCLGFAIGLGVAYMVPGSDLVRGLAGGACGGAVVGAITGAALVRLLANSRVEAVS